MALYAQPMMVEEFISGEEVTVGLLGNNPPRITGIMHVVPRKKSPDFVYSLEVKRNWQQMVQYECPAKSDESVLHNIQDSCLKAFKALGIRDLARMDFRISADGTPYFLEVNPLPGLNPKSGDYRHHGGGHGLELSIPHRRSSQFGYREVRAWRLGSLWFITTPYPTATRQMGEADAIADVLEEVKAVYDALLEMGHERRQGAAGAAHRERPRHAGGAAGRYILQSFRGLCRAA